MTGYIKITAITRNGHEGLNIKTDVQSVSFMDRMQVLDVLCRGLHIRPTELELFVAMKNKGILDEAFEIGHTHDEHDVDLLDQLLDTVLGGDNK